MAETSADYIREDELAPPKIGRGTVKSIAQNPQLRYGHVSVHRGNGRSSNTHLCPRCPRHRVDLVHHQALG